MKHQTDQEAAWQRLRKNANVISIRPMPAGIFAAIKGKLDSLSAGQLHNDLELLIIGQPIKLVLDIEQLDYISSAGVGTLVSLRHRLGASGGELCLVRTPEPVYDVLSLLRFTDLFRFCNDENEAWRG